MQNLNRIQKDSNTPSTFQYADSLCSSGKVATRAKDFQEKKKTPEIIKTEATPEQLFEEFYRTGRQPAPKGYRPAPNPYGYPDLPIDTEKSS